MAMNFAFGLSILMTVYLFFYAFSEIKKEYKTVSPINYLLAIIMAFVFSGIAYLFI
ncbi:hypothetical protein [Bacillus sp. FJAT-49736]|uniref:hypothetical protein n=1 Tax=Bacillus sp. FJAT-49736 TaxID=2833582 RepID=UPI001BC8DE92|nr:hypothetical protein [Bacillus sp. FJAT-49736]MBS4173908.1 hypothetical protein [Bacillus sp. FJAT-49736]